jgi:hypothetical protein
MLPFTRWSLRTLLIMGLVYLIVLIIGVGLLYFLVPTSVWQTIYNVYGGGDQEAVGG